MTHVVIARSFVNPNEPATFVTEFEESTRPADFTSQLFFRAGGYEARALAFKEGVNWVFQTPDRPEFRHFSVSGLLISGPPHDTWTVQTSSVISADAGVAQGISELRSMVEGLRHGLTPSRTPGFIALARRAVEHKEQQDHEDVEAWADRLARDFSRATD
jgi:hypothetical protein